MLARRILAVSVSPKNTIPPSVARQGTLSWMVLAVVALSNGRSEYQSR